MPYPSMSDYREALQNPRLAFKSSDLQSADVETSPLGLPRLVSGGFALTACLTTKSSFANSKLAIRCFHKEVPTLQDRYKYISDFFSKINDNFLVKFSYEPEGIKVHGKYYPIVRMAWVEGVSLNEYLDANITSPVNLIKLAENLRNIGKRLNQLNMAHGDLQHGNILVRSDGSPILIDYDGTYVPNMPYNSSNETGHPSFQHPERGGNFFNEKIDNFSLIVLYVTLQACATHGQKLQKYRDSEKLIFGKDDYKKPNESQIFSELVNCSKVGAWVKRLQHLCQCRVNDIPNLEYFLNQTISLPLLPTIPISGSISPSEVIKNQVAVVHANNLLHLIKQEGNLITVVGRVTSSLLRSEMAFINFGFRSTKTINKVDYYPFTVVIFAEVLKTWNSRGIPIDSLKDRYVQVTGLLELYPKDKSAYAPQIILQDPYQLKITSEHEYKMTISPNPNTPVTKSNSSVSTGNVIPPKPIPPKPNIPVTKSNSSVSTGNVIPPKPIPPKPTSSSQNLQASQTSTSINQSYNLNSSNKQPTSSKLTQTSSSNNSSITPPLPPNTNQSIPQSSQQAKISQTTSPLTPISNVSQPVVPPQEKVYNVNKNVSNNEQQKNTEKGLLGKLWDFLNSEI